MQTELKKPRKRTARVIFAKKRTVKQRVWEYMRRNKVFRVKDIMSILDVKEHTIRTMLYALETAGYIRRKTDDTSGRKVLLQATFIFLAKDNILICPIIKSNEVYCMQTKTKTDIGARKILLNALKHFSQKEVGELLGVSKTTINLVLHNKYPEPHLIYKRVRECL